MASHRLTAALTAALTAILACATLFYYDAASANPEQERAKPRCGWFQNPTPGNAWLSDKDGEWVVGTQGGHQADGDWPDFNGKNWVKTNGSYGYGCACMVVVVNAKTKEIQRIVSSRVQSIKTCKNDPKLAKPDA